MNSTPFADSQERILLRNRAIKVAKSNYENLVSMSISNLFFEDNRLRFDKEIESIKTEALKTPLQGYVATQEGMKIRVDRTKILENLNCKKLIIVGKNDPILSKMDLQHLETLNGINIVGLRRINVSNKKIIELTDAYKKIFVTENLTENLNKLNGEFKENSLVNEIVDFINKDKKRPICTPYLK